MAQMPIDMRRIAMAAVDAAFDQVEEAKRKKKRSRLLSPKRAVIAGAALMTAGRLAWSGRGRGLLGSLEERLSGFGEAGGAEEAIEEFDEDEEFDEPEAEEEPEDEPEAEEEPDEYDEEDEDVEDDGAEEPQEEDEEVEERAARRRQPKAGSRAKRRN